MTWILVAGLLAIAVLVWYSGSQPYHHRGIRPGALPDFFANLFRDGDGSYMIIEDERTKVELVVERVSGNREAVIFRMLPATHSPSNNPLCEITCRRNSQAADAIAALMAEFTGRGSDASATFHIHFRSEPGTDGLRERWQAVLSDPNSSEFRRRVARRGLAKIDSANDQRGSSGS